LPLGPTTSSFDCGISEEIQMSHRKLSNTMTSKAVRILIWLWESGHRKDQLSQGLRT
jgi:hypothetical protein